MTKQRNSSIEMLKIIAIALIVINHVTMSINKVPEVGIRIGTASSDINVIILTIFRHFGAIGNAIFMVCTSWFLTENREVDREKVFRLILDVWIVSVIIFGIVLLWGGYRVTLSDTVRALFPTTFNNNWYITCYIMIYALHGVLNHLIDSLPQKRLLLFTIVLIVLFTGFGTISNRLLYYSNLLLFITIYFLVAYVKKYQMPFCNNIKLNTAIFAASAIALGALIVVINVIGLHVGLLKNRILLLEKNGNPLIIILAISSLNIARQFEYHNNTIDYISSVSLLIYLIHENLIVRKHIRPMIWKSIHEQFGNANIILVDLVFALGLFLAALVFGALYKKLLQKHVYRISDFLSSIFSTLYGKLEATILNWQ